MLITKEMEIDMAHRIPSHKSKCRSLHGHRYKIEVGVDDKLIEEGSSEGMVIDFGDLKWVMAEEIDKKYDHNAIFYRYDPIIKIIDIISPYQPKTPIIVDFIPTAENLAKHWFYLLKFKLEAKGVKIKHVKVWETPTSTAIFLAPSEY